jgi:transcription elongation factor Elf1
MSDDLPRPFACKKCGAQKFKVSGEAKPDGKLVGFACSNCGASVTEDDILQYTDGAGIEAGGSLPKRLALKRVG